MLWFILSSTEPLHDVKEHISNIITEIVAHLQVKKRSSAFHQDYRATKMCQNFSRGSNVDDLSAQYFDAAIAFRPTWSQSSGATFTDGRKSAASQSAYDEF